MNRKWKYPCLFDVLLVLSGCVSAWYLSSDLLAPLLIVDKSEVSDTQPAPVFPTIFPLPFPLPPLAPMPMNLPSPAKGSPRRFRVTALPQAFEANQINNEGEIVGTFDTGRRNEEGDSITKAALWNNGGLRIFPSHDDDSQCTGVAINDASVVGGNCGKAGSGAISYEHADVMLWNLSKRYPMLSLGHLPGLSHANLQAINRSGQVMGTSCPSDPMENRQFTDKDFEGNEDGNIFFWDGKRMRDMGRCEGPCEISDLNDRGQAVGTLNGQIVLWSASEKHILGYGTGVAINNRSQIIASATYSFPHAILYGHGVWKDLGVLPGRERSTATSINDRCQIVGYSSGADSHAFLWQDDAMYDLNASLPQNSGWVLREARSINNQGLIVGIGTFRSKERSFLLTPKRTSHE